MSRPRGEDIDPPRRLFLASTCGPLKNHVQSVSYDFLICFECGYVMVYSGGERLAYLHLKASPQPLNDLLIVAKVTLPKPPQE